MYTSDRTSNRKQPLQDSEVCMCNNSADLCHLDLLGNSSYSKIFSIPVELNTGDNIAFAAWVPIGQ